MILISKNLCKFKEKEMKKTEDIEEIDKDDGALELTNNSNVIPLSAYTNLKRGISEEDLNTPAVQKILLSELDKLESRIDEKDILLNQKSIDFLELKESYHLIDKEKAVLDEKFKTSTSQEVLYSFCIAAGSAIIGFSKVVWDQGYGALFIVVGLFLITGGIISKAVKWK